jgi:RNA polymerase sigma factor (sigma-70 family)
MQRDADMGNTFSLESLQKENELLKKRIEWLENVLERVPAMIYVGNNDNKVIVWCNRGWEDFLGLSKEEVREMGPQIFADIMHPDDFNLTMQAQDHFKNNKSMFSGMARFRMKGTNDYRWMVGTAVPFVRDQDGQIKEIVSAFLDLSVIGDSNKQLIDALNEVLRRQHDNLLNKLTAREKEILALAVQGLNNKEIARQLNLSRYTIETHRKNIRLKLKVHNMTELAAVARKLGFQ